MQETQTEATANSNGVADAIRKAKRRPSMPGYLSQADFADRMGCDVATLWRWHRKGYGPPITKVGFAVFYREEAITEWLRSLEKKPIDRSRRKATRTKRTRRAL